MSVYFWLTTANIYAASLIVMVDKPLLAAGMVIFSALIAIGGGVD